MKNPIKIFTSLVVFLFAYNLSFAQVNSDYDKSTDFSKYKTYTFAGWQKNSDQLLNDLDKKRVLEAFKAEFASRNMTLVTENGDAAVSLYLVIDNKTSTTAYTNYTGGMGYGAGMGRGWGMGVGGVGIGSSTTTYNNDDYKEGTLVVDLYDATSKTLIWQGTLQSVISDKASKRDKTIPKKIGKLMGKFPVDAGK